MLSLRWHRSHVHGLSIDSAGKGRVSKHHAMNSRELHGDSTHQSQVTLSQKVAFPQTMSLRAAELSSVDWRKSLSPCSPLGPRKKGPLWGIRGIIPTWEIGNARCFPLSSFSAPNLGRPHRVNEPALRKRLKIHPRNITTGLCSFVGKRATWVKSPYE